MLQTRSFKWRFLFLEFQKLKIPWGLEPGLLIFRDAQRRGWLNILCARSVEDCEELTVKL
jgi:hypothetical protein